MDWEFELVAGPYGETTEGPAWDGEALLFTHIIESRMMRYDPKTGASKKTETIEGNDVSITTPNSADSVLVMTTASL